MADAENQVVQGGHLVKILAGGIEVGWARTSTLAQDYGTEGVYAIGDIGPVEHIPLRWSAQITLDEFVIHRQKINDAVQLLNLAPMGPEDTLRAGLIDFEILDDTDDLMLLYESCTISNYQITVTANSLSGQNATFQAKNVIPGTYDKKGLADGVIGRPAVESGAAT